MPQRTREELRELFSVGALPTEQDYADRADSSINQLDDHVHVDHEKNIGIGTDEPQAKLHVNGGTQIDEDLNVIGNAKVAKTLDISGDANIDNALNVKGEVKLEKNLDVAGALGVQGDVGIGTDTPTTKLSISPSEIESKITLWTNTASPENHFGFGISGNQLNYHVNSEGDNHVFYAGGKNGDGTELMRIKGNGNVGIGTQTPEAPLSITGDGKWHSPDESMHITNGCILFGGSNKGEDINSAQISAGKHVPNSLNIVGMSADADHLTRKIDCFAEGGFIIHGDIKISGDIWNRPLHTYSLEDRNTAYVRLKKHHSHDITDNAMQDVYWAGKDYKSSDQRLKTNITPLSSSLKKVSQLQSVTYQWNETAFQRMTADVEKDIRAEKEEDNQKLWDEKKADIRKKNSGIYRSVIAQELEKVFPEWVDEDKDGYKIINTEELPFVLIEAIKELKQEKDAEIETLKKQNTLLEKRLAALEAK